MFSKTFKTLPVAVKSLLGNSIVSSLVPVELPDDEGLVPGAGEDHVRVLGVGGDLGHPAVVAPEGAPQLESLGHLDHESYDTF